MKLYPCDYCKHVAVRLSHLQTHELVHTPRDGCAVGCGGCLNAWLASEAKVVRYHSSSCPRPEGVLLDGWVLDTSPELERYGRPVRDRRGEFQERVQRDYDEREARHNAGEQRAVERRQRRAILRRSQNPLNYSIQVQHNRVLPPPSSTFYSSPFTVHQQPLPRLPFVESGSTSAGNFIDSVPQHHPEASAHQQFGNFILPSSPQFNLQGAGSNYYDPNLFSIPGEAPSHNSHWFNSTFPAARYLPAQPTDSSAYPLHYHGLHDTRHPCNLEFDQYDPQGGIHQPTLEDLGNQGGSWHQQSLRKGMLSLSYRQRARYPDL